MSKFPISNRLLLKIDGLDSTMKKIKFGLLVPQGWKLDLPPELSSADQFDSIKRMARDAEALGYDSIWLYDHFHTIPRIEPAPVFECWATLSALAMCTEKIGLGQLVTCNSYRNPALLAKQASVLDVISGGRLLFGIGAGWYEHEYLGFGFDFPEPSVRVAMLDEAVQIIKKLWTEQRVNFEGKYYSLRGGINYPKPLQKPHPPILIGGGGEKLTLKVVAKHADIYNWWGGGALATAEETVDAFKRKLEILKRYCKTLGKDFEKIEKSFSTDVILAEDEEGARSMVKRLIRERKAVGRYRGGDKWKPISAEEYVREKLVGTPEQCIDRLERFVDLGTTYFIFYFPLAIETESHRLFAEKVIPEFKTR